MTTSSIQRRLLATLVLTGSISALLAFETRDAFANVVGTDTQNFNPITSGLDFVTVQSSETLKPGIVNLGLFLNYAVNSLPYIQDTSQSRDNFNDTLLGLDLNAGVGLMRGWDVGISLPQVLMQDVQDETGAHGEYSRTGLTDIRLNSKVRLLGDDSQGLALIGTIEFNQIQDNPYVGDGAGPTLDFEVAGDTTIDRVALGLNLGYRARNPGTAIAGSGITPLGNQLIASAAASYLVHDWDTKFITEIFGSAPVKSTDDNSNRSLSSAEWLVGAKHDLTMNLALHAGVSTGLSRGLASPDWRVYTGINYTFGPLWRQSPERTATVVKNGTPQPYTEHYIEVLPATQTASGPIEHFRTQQILFGFDKDNLEGTSGAALDELVQYLKKGFRELVVEGHTDSIGKVSYNMKLSERRAETIRRYLIGHYHLDPKKITVIGYGPTKPIADNGNYQGRQLNRRVDFEVRR